MDIAVMNSGDVSCKTEAEAVTRVVRPRDGAAVETVEEKIPLGRVDARARRGDAKFDRTVLDADDHEGRGARPKLVGVLEKVPHGDAEQILVASHERLVGAVDTDFRETPVDATARIAREIGEVHGVSRFRSPFFGARQHEERVHQSG